MGRLGELAAYTVDNWQSAEEGAQLARTDDEIIEEQESVVAPSPN